MNRPLVPEDLHRAARAVSDNNRIVLPWALRGQLWASRSNVNTAVERMIACRAPAAAIEIVKAPVGANSTLAPGYQSAVAGFVDSMSAESVFYRLLSDRAFQPASFYTRTGFTPTPPVAALVGEGHAKPLSVAPLAFVTLTPQKEAVADVITREALDDVSAAGQQHLMSRLQQAVARAVDGTFLAGLVDTGTTQITSAGTSAINAKHDLWLAGQAMSKAGAGRFVWALAPDVGWKASTLADAAGLDAFPQMTPTGGTMCGVPAVVSGGIPSGEAFLIDGSGIVGNGETITTRASDQADMEMSSTPVGSSAMPTAASMVNMFQTNCVAYIAEASFGFVKLRDDACAHVTGINWGGP